MALAIAQPAAEAASLRGSRSSLHRQNRIAKRNHFSYTRNAKQVRKFVNAGLLLPIRGNRDYRLKGVSFPYGRPEVRLFVERLSGQYRSACGEQLVVTSLTRPKARQPRNASSISVHPTGMAIDLRRSTNRRCRSWLEKVLLSLEKGGVIEATRERHPPHYHVAVFPKAYEQYVARLEGGRSSGTYRVRGGDTLWEISQKAGVSVSALMQANQLSDANIRPGQSLTIPN